MISVNTVKEMLREFFYMKDITAEQYLQGIKKTREHNSRKAVEQVH